MTSAAARSAGRASEVDPVRLGLDVREDGSRAEARHRSRRREKGERRREDAVAGFHAEGHQPREEGVGAARHPDDSDAAELLPHRALERFHLACRG